ncbi:MAG: restriction endonuclease [Firmicutes bacterium]|nr:restriction endonuclease [Bacillota bacterium]HPZ89733.1 restriction endonuclease [Bacillota bacterium]HQE01251.1 restriction endonuclease [Bacillota bacterium]
MEFLRFLTFFAFLAVLGFGLYWVKEYRDKTRQLNSVIADLVNCNGEMKKTLLQGLVPRFGAEDEADPALDFARFVARLLRMKYGGKTSVTMANALTGVDIQFWRGQDLLLGRAICCPQQQPIDFEPVAVLHSQMLKQGAKGGFVVTTSDFTPQARKYAQDLAIDLINGPRLIDLWVSALKQAPHKQRETAQAQEA